MKLKIILFIIFNSILYSQYNNLLNFNTNINDNEVKIIFNLKTNENKLIVNADIPKNYYGYLESSIANKIKFFADNKEINAIYPKGEKFHNDIIIKGNQEFILNMDIKNINFIKVDYQLCSDYRLLVVLIKMIKIKKIIIGEILDLYTEVPPYFLI